MSEGNPLKPSKLAAEGWQSREELVLDKKYFQFQYDFAREFSERTGVPFLEVVNGYTTFLRNALDPSLPDGQIALRNGITEDDIVDGAHRVEMREVAEHQGTALPHYEGKRFGCFRYDFHADQNAIEIHFFNAEFDEEGPLDNEKVELRKKEFKDMLTDIKARCPEASELYGKSWLVGLPAFRRLFPEGSFPEAEIDRDPTLWHKGTIWGQFMDSKYQLREKLAERFLKKARTLPVRDMVLALPLPPKIVRVPLAALYQQYGVN